MRIQQPGAPGEGQEMDGHVLQGSRDGERRFPKSVFALQHLRDATTTIPQAHF